MYNGDVQIGYGWIYYRSDGLMSVPELFYDDGTEIPEGYYNLQPTSETHLVIIPKGVQ